MAPAFGTRRFLTFLHKGGGKDVANLSTTPSSLMGEGWDGGDLVAGMLRFSSLSCSGLTRASMLADDTAQVARWTLGSSPRVTR